MHNNIKISRLTREELNNAEYANFLREIFTLTDVTSRIACSKWLFQDNPESPTSEDLPIYICWKGNNILGQLGIMPSRALVGGEFVNIGWCVDFHVSSKAQRQGVGANLLKAAYSDFTILSTLGQSELAYKLFIKSGWSDCGAMTYCKQIFNVPLTVPKILLQRLNIFAKRKIPYKKLPSWDGNRLNSVSFEPIDSYTQCKSILETAKRLNPGCFVNKNVDFMNWRYIECPQSPYLNLKLTHCEIEAVAVLRLYELDGWRRGRLVDFICSGTSDDKVITIFMKAVEAFARKSGVEIFECETSDIHAVGTLFCNAFSSRAKSKKFLYSRRDAEQQLVLQIENWRLYPGDCDVDIVTYMNELAS